MEEVPATAPEKRAEHPDEGTRAYATIHKRICTELAEAKAPFVVKPPPLDNMGQIIALMERVAVRDLCHARREIKFAFFAIDGSPRYEVLDHEDLDELEASKDDVACTAFWGQIRRWYVSECDRAHDRLDGLYHEHEGEIEQVMQNQLRGQITKAWIANQPGLPCGWTGTTCEFWVQYQ